jgi:hypothetical protein
MFLLNLVVVWNKNIQEPWKTVKFKNILRLLLCMFYSAQIVSRFALVST